MKKKFSTKIFSFRNRVVIIILGFIIGTSSLLFTNNMARQLREKEQNEVIRHDDVPVLLVSGIAGSG